MDTLAAQVEVWKKIVDVQQHFNDLELRIRNFALVVTGAFLGLGGYAIKDGSAASFAGYSAASLIIAASLLPLGAFYLMDRLWYHRLLDGSVKAGIAAEKKLIDLGIQVDLGSQISKASPFKFLGVGPNVHSRHKMDGFYGLLAVAIIALAVTLSHEGKSGKLEPVPPVAKVAPSVAGASDDKKPLSPPLPVAGPNVANASVAPEPTKLAPVSNGANK